MREWINTIARMMLVETDLPPDRAELLRQRAELDRAIDQARAAFNEERTRANIEAFWAAVKKQEEFDEQYRHILWPQEQHTPEPEPDTYKGQHTAPDHDTGSPLYDVTLNGTYPADFYSLAHQYEIPGPSLSLAFAYHNRPNAPVKIYRAIPKDIPRKINVGDWVCIVRRYAVEHGRANLRNDYVIVSKTVYARDVFTAGDSIDEWGYDPQPRVERRKKNV